jgi:hypothetical protein
VNGPTAVAQPDLRAQLFLEAEKTLNQAKRKTGRHLLTEEFCTLHRSRRDSIIIEHIAKGFSNVPFHL